MKLNSAQECTLNIYKDTINHKRCLKESIQNLLASADIPYKNNENKSSLISKLCEDGTTAISVMSHADYDVALITIRKHLSFTSNRKIYEIADILGIEIYDRDGYRCSYKAMSMRNVPLLVEYVVSHPEVYSEHAVYVSVSSDDENAVRACLENLHLYSDDISISSYCDNYNRLRWRAGVSLVVDPTQPCGQTRG